MPNFTLSDADMRTFNRIVSASTVAAIRTGVSGMLAAQATPLTDALALDNIQGGIVSAMWKTPRRAKTGA